MRLRIHAFAGTWLAAKRTRDTAIPPACGNEAGLPTGRATVKPVRRALPALYFWWTGDSPTRGWSLQLNRMLSASRSHLRRTCPAHRANLDSATAPSWLEFAARGQPTTLLLGTSQRLFYALGRPRARSVFARRHGPQFTQVLENSGWFSRLTLHCLCSFDANHHTMTGTGFDKEVCGPFFVKRPAQACRCEPRDAGRCRRASCPRIASRAKAWTQHRRAGRRPLLRRLGRHGRTARCAATARITGMASLQT